MIAYSFVLMNLLKGKSWAQIKDVLAASYFSTVKAGWRIWPASQLVNQSLVPLYARTVSMDFVSFFWDMYLTIAISGKDDASNAPGTSASLQASASAPPVVAGGGSGDGGGGGDGAEVIADDNADGGSGEHKN